MELYYRSFIDESNTCLVVIQWICYFYFYWSYFCGNLSRKSFGYHLIGSFNMLKVLVVGAGAVGLGLASFLLQSGCHVSLLARDDTELVKNGLYWVGILGEFYSDSFEILYGPAKDTKVDFVLCKIF